MKTKSFIKFFIGCTFLFMLTSCREDKITFSFTLGCSEDLLAFVEPSATFIDANGEECVVKLDKSKFTKENRSGLVENNDPVMYIWRREIVLSGASKAQRDMLVKYKLRSDAPAIVSDKEYQMEHQLGCSYTKETGGGLSSPSIDVSSKIEITLGSTTRNISGDQLQAYLDNLVENPDYVKKEVE